MTTPQNTLSVPSDLPKVGKAYIKRSDKSRIQVHLKLDCVTTGKLSIVQRLAELKTKDGRVLSMSLLARRALNLYLDKLLQNHESGYSCFLSDEKEKLESMASTSNRKYVNASQGQTAINQEQRTQPCAL